MFAILPIIFTIPVYAMLLEEATTFPASDSVIFAFLDGMCELENFLGLFGVSALPRLILLAFSCPNMARTGVLLTPLELGVENGMERVAGGDFFCPVSLDKMSDMEKGED